MLGRKNFTPDEIGRARAAVDEQLTAYRDLADAVDKAGDAAVGAALQALEPVLFNAMVLALDRYFVHRLRTVTGKDGNALNEVELVAESLMAGDGTLRAHNVIKYKPADAVLGLAPGDRIRLTADGFEALSDAFFAELVAKFL